MSITIETNRNLETERHLDKKKDKRLSQIFHEYNIFLNWSQDFVVTL